MRRWLLAAGMWMFASTADAGNELELFEEDQRIARYSFIVGASAPVLLAAGALLSEEQPITGGLIAGTGVAISAVSLPLLGRRSMLAGDHLDLTGGKGAIALFFGIGTLLSGTYYVAIDQSSVGAATYLACTAGALMLGGLQLRENRFVATMRTDPRSSSLRISPTPRGLLLTGTF
jgi:hypothetical protein